VWSTKLAVLGSSDESLLLVARDHWREALTPHLPRIAVIGCGGTISSLAHSPLDTIDYPEYGRKLSVDELLERLPEARLIANPVVIPFRSIGSSAMTPTDWIELRDLIQEAAASRPGIAGFVILHGTATLEETAYFLDLTLDLDSPVVLVGAQRPFGAVSSDASMNIISALRIAGAKEAHGKGVLVTLSDEIHAARDVTKTSSYRLHAFRSPECGLLGQVDADRVRFFRVSLHRYAPHSEFAVPRVTKLPRVDIVYSYAGVDATFIEAAVAAGARGIVSAGFAPGLPTPAERAALERAVACGITVVQCTRVLSGRVARRQYLRNAGIIAGNDLSPQKARILLSLALTGSRTPDEIANLFDVY
jgi:L-asparaginase